MTYWRPVWFAVAVMAGWLLVPEQAVVAQQPELSMLRKLTDGRWELRGRDGSVRRMCVGDRSRLIQLRHPELPCSHIVIEDSANSVTVQYTCRGRGYGRTHIRKESAQLIQLDTQGIAEGLPFEFSAEGRWIGECAP